MSQLVALVLLSCLWTHVSCLISFINPPPFGKTGDFSENPTYSVGSIVNVAWQGGEDGKGVSLVLYQLNQTDGQWFGDMEYLAQNSLGVTRFSWLVGTRKNMTLSNLFYLSIYQEGKGVSDANSHYFNLAAAKDTAVTTTSSTSPSSTSSATISETSSASPTASLSTTLSTSAQLSSTSSITVPTSATDSASQSSSSAEASDSFPTVAKIGLGVGIPAALVLGIGAGFLLFRRHKKRGNMAVAMAPAPYPPTELHAQYKHHEAGYYTPKPHEAPLMSPVELGHRGDPYGVYPNHEAGRTANKNNGHVRYEM